MILLLETTTRTITHTSRSSALTHQSRQNFLARLMGTISKKKNAPNLVTFLPLKSFNHLTTSCLVLGCRDLSGCKSCPNVGNTFNLDYNQRHQHVTGLTWNHLDLDQFCLKSPSLFDIQYMYWQYIIQFETNCCNLSLHLSKLGFQMD